ncbi:Lipase [Monoraphidium neglectum]|uniref:Lipase n=1 Tax=Monoraphidium neglectum TaxID=145388 RepID=A0A0D2LJT0_9CHLO|nr:Lipase [Monoraphidium neglectum]KIY92224.1 Lipase [Monoraphidium neglectum]|eukprot:XP_013891244.1 Lipase [Monoraphidium neglectum]
MVHSGFLNAYDSVKVKVFTLVDQITESATPSKPWRVRITGHSLGGAIATLCAYDLSARPPKTGAGSLEVSMYTFGAPRVGNKAFAKVFDERLHNRAWRITNASDIVPSVPRLMGYSHALPRLV